MDLRLVTDFTDYYDFAFSRTGRVFRRMATEGMPRREMFAFFNRLGLGTPRHGLVREVVPAILTEYAESMPKDLVSEMSQVVVYTDENAHRGEGKELLSLRDALRLTPDHYCSEYVLSNALGLGESMRLLQVGQKSWWIRSSSYTDWRSNCGEGCEKVITAEHFTYNCKINLPLWAIDFVSVDGVPKCAVDFNSAPGLAPLRGILAPRDVYSLLCEAVEHHHGGDHGNIDAAKKLFDHECSG